ncbi:hypothetical protein [Nostoc sp. UHCC 0251]|nr:hypothetical protein [Nostoc sp. UHCC 0251]MEA5626528.1 hypothetical protein [Nostoc sp. UHCC 0251]
MKAIIITGFSCVTLIAGIAIIKNVPISVALSAGGTTLAVVAGAYRP